MPRFFVVRGTRVISAAPAAVALAALLTLPGCYRLAPLDTETPDAGSEVRLGLTDAGSVQLAHLVGPRIEAIEGRTVQVSDSALVVAVSSAFDRAGVERPWNHEQLSVPLGAIDQIQRRELDRKKTWFVSGASVVGLFLVSRAFDWGAGETRIPSRDGGNVQK